LSRAIDIFEGLVAEFPERPEYRSELALTLHNLAAMDAARGRHADAEPYFRRAIDAWRPLLGPIATGGDVPARVGMANAHRNLAIGLQQGPRAAEASTHYAASRDLLVGVLQIEPGRDEAALALGGTLFNWAIFLSFLPDRRAESLDLFGQAIDRIAPIHAREGSWERARTELLTAHGGRAQLLAAVGRFTDSVKDWERVVDLEGPNPSSDNRFYLATARVRAEDRVGALEMVKVLEPLLAGRSTAHALHLARVCGMALDGVGRKSDLPESERRIWADRFAREGIEILRSLLARCGVIERAVLRRTLPDDPDLAPLLARPEARDLLAAKAVGPLNPAAAPGPRDNK
jgi:tetratricopeptide (TPR) repeat protein